MTSMKTAGFNWWKWTLIAGIVLALLAGIGGAIGWAISGPSLAGEVIAYICAFGLPAALIIEAIAARAAE
jgi:zinc transporter ZupT